MEGDILSFVVRIWHEAVDSEGNAVTWRGYVDHVGSDKRLYFCDLDKVVSFIQREAGLNAQQAQAEQDDLTLSRWAAKLTASLKRLFALNTNADCDGLQ